MMILKKNLKRGLHKKKNGIKGEKLSDLCFPVNEYLPRKYAGKIFECIILKPRESLKVLIIKQEQYF